MWWCTPVQEDQELEALATAALPLPGMAELLTMDPNMLEVSGCGFGAVATQLVAPMPLQ
jgi:hypothetical protein